MLNLPYLECSDFRRLRYAVNAIILFGIAMALHGCGRHWRKGQEGVLLPQHANAPLDLSVPGIHTAVTAGSGRWIVIQAGVPIGTLLGMWNMESNVLEWARILQIDSSLLAVSPDERHILVQTPDRRINVFSMLNGQLLSVHHYKWPVVGIDFSPSGSQIAISVPKSPRLQVFDYRWWRPVKTYSEVPPLSPIQFGPNGEYLLGMTYHSAPTHLYTIHLDTGRIVLQNNTGINGEIVQSPDGRYIYWGENTVGCYDVRTRSIVWRFGYLREPVWAIACVRRGSRIVVSQKSDLFTLDALTGSVLARIDNAHEGGIRSICSLGDGSRIVTGGSDGALRIWTVDTLKENVDKATLFL